MGGIGSWREWHDHAFVLYREGQPTCYCGSTLAEAYTAYCEAQRCDIIYLGRIVIEIPVEETL